MQFLLFLFVESDHGELLIDEVFEENVQPLDASFNDNAVDDN